LLLVLLASALAFGLDRLSKIIIVEVLDLISVGTILIWPPYFQFVMAWNKGVNFGVLSDFDARWLLVAFSVAVSMALAIWARKLSGWVLPLAAGTIIGGALGNAYDRVVYGAVADYLNVSCCGINNPYSFNVADVLIFGGAFIIVAYDVIKGRNTPSSFRPNR
jgi:signal peptidase II